MQKINKINLKEFKKKILLFVIIILVFFIFLEIILRLFSYPIYGFEKGFFQQDDITGYNLSSNFTGTHSIYGKISDVRTNSHGLRDDREYLYEKRNSTRIIILGDSFAFGNGVNIEESYPEYLRELYKNQDVEVINFGVPGYGINNEYLSFIEEGLNYDPDVVLIGYVTNDWNTHQIIKKDDGQYIINKSHTLFVNKKGLMVSPSKKISLHSIHLFLLFEIRSYSFIYSKSRLILDNVVNIFYTHKAIPSYYWDNSSLEYKQAYDGYYSLLKMLKESTNATIVIFIGPFCNDLVSQEEVKNNYGIDYDLDILQTQKSVKEIANKLEIKVIEVSSEEKDIFLAVDGHWNFKGHKIMAEKIYDDLRPIIEKLSK